jgi:hypothetical protein
MVSFPLQTPKEIDLSKLPPGQYVSYKGSLEGSQPYTRRQTDYNAAYTAKSAKTREQLLSAYEAASGLAMPPHPEHCRESPILMSADEDA